MPPPAPTAPADRTVAGLQDTVLRLETLVDSVQAGVLVEDADRTIWLVNPAFCQIFGVDDRPADLVGRDARSALGWTRELLAEPDLLLPWIDEPLEGRSEVLSEELRLADGRTLERDSIPLRCNGVPSGHLWVFRDVTAHKRTEEELERTAQRYRDFVDNGVASAWSHGLEGTLRSANRALLHAVGAVEESQVVGRNLLDFLEPRFRGEYESYLRVLQEAGEAKGFATFRGFDGKRRVLAYSNVLRRDENGEPEVRGFGEDVTENVRSQQALHHANLHLESVNAALAATNLTLERTTHKMELINEMGELIQAAQDQRELEEVLRCGLPQIFSGLPGVLYLEGAEPSMLEPAASWGHPPPLADPLEASSCWALRRGRASFSNPPVGSPLCQHVMPEPGPQACPRSAGDAEPATLCVPLLAQSQVLGLLHLRERQRTESNGEWESLASAEQVAYNAAEQISFGLVNLRLRERLLAREAHPAAARQDGEPVKLRLREAGR